jgi:transposase
MVGFVEGLERSQTSLFPASLEDYVTEDNPVRAIDAFVDGIDLRKLGFTSIDPLRPGGRAITLERC